MPILVSRHQHNKLLQSTPSQKCVLRQNVHYGTVKLQILWVWLSRPWCLRPVQRATLWPARLGHDINTCSKPKQTLPLLYKVYYILICRIYCQKHKHYKVAACHASAKEQRFRTLKMGISITFVSKRTMAAARWVYGRNRSQTRKQVNRTTLICFAFCSKLRKQRLWVKQPRM